MVVLFGQQLMENGNLAVVFYFPCPRRTTALLWLLINLIFTSNWPFMVTVLHFPYPRHMHYQSFIVQISIYIHITHLLWWLFFSFYIHTTDLYSGSSAVSMSQVHYWPLLVNVYQFLCPRHATDLMMHQTNWVSTCFHSEVTHQLWRVSINWVKW